MPSTEVPYTPSINAIRGWYTRANPPFGDAEFDRWLAAHDVEVARKTLEDAADEVLTVAHNFAHRGDIQGWLRARAASISTDKAGAGE